MRGRLSFKTQLTCTFIGLLLVTLLLVVLHMNVQVVEMLAKNTETNTSTGFERMEAEIFSLQQEVSEVVQMLIMHPQIKEFCTDRYELDVKGISLRKALGVYLDQVLILYPDICSIVITTSYGTTIGTEGNFNYNSAELDIDSETAAGNSVKWGSGKLNSYTAKQSGDRNVVNLTTQFSYRGSGITKVCVSIKATSLFGLIAPYGTGDGVPLLLCDESFRVVVAGDEAKIGTIPDYLEKFDSTTENQGGFFYTANRDDNREQQQIVYRTLKIPQWTLIEEIPLKQYTQDIDRLRTSFIIVFAISCLVAVILSLLFIYRMTAPLKLLTAAMNKMRSGEVGYQIQDRSNNEFGELIDCFNSMSSDMAGLIEQNRKIEKEKSRYALTALKSRINPHFLFNTINTIRWMAISQKADNIQAALGMLMTLIKPLFKEKSIWISLGDEIAYVENYVELINLRFGSMIVLEPIFSEADRNIKIPRFILQPIVENCVEHGLSDKKADGKIRILREPDEGMLVLSVEDNGWGMTPEDCAVLNEKLAASEGEIAENGEKIGLSNVNQRIRVVSGAEYGLSAGHGELGGLKILMKLPII